MIQSSLSERNASVAFRSWKIITRWEDDWKDNLCIASVYLLRSNELIRKGNLEIQQLHIDEDATQFKLNVTRDIIIHRNTFIFRNYNV